MAPSLSTLPVTLRPWRVGDEAALVKHADNRKVSRNMRDRFPFPYTLKDAQDWIRLATTPSPIENFAIEVAPPDGPRESVGGIGLMLGSDISRFSAEIGYWLGETYWGRGIAPEAVRQMTDYGFATFGLKRIFAGVFETNPASGRVLEKAGYLFEGTQRKSVFKEGRFLDQLLYAKIAD